MPNLLYRLWLPSLSSFMSSATVRMYSLVSACSLRYNCFIRSRNVSASLVFSCNWYFSSLFSSYNLCILSLKLSLYSLMYFYCSFDLELAS